MESDYSLIYKIKTNADSNALIEFTARHEGLIIQQFSRYCHESGVSIEDLSQDKYLVANNAANSWDEKFKVKPASWLGNCARFHALNTIKHITKHEKCSSYEPKELEKAIDGVKCFDEEAKHKNFIDWVLFLASEHKDERIHKIIQQYYFSTKKTDRTFGKIGEKLKMTSQGVKLLHDGFMKFVKRKIQSENNLDVL